MQTNLVEETEEAGKRNTDTIGVINLNPFAAGQPRNREGHRDPVIAEAPDFGPAEARSAVDQSSVFALLNLYAEPPEAFGHCADPVRFLVAQFFHIKKVRNTLCERSHSCEDRVFVDRSRHELRAASTPFRAAPGLGDPPPVRRLRPARS